MLRPLGANRDVPKPLHGGTLARSSPEEEWKSTRGAAITHLLAAGEGAEHRRVAERHTGSV